MILDRVLNAIIWVNLYMSCSARLICKPYLQQLSKASTCISLTLEPIRWCMHCWNGWLDTLVSLPHCSNFMVAPHAAVWLKRRGAVCVCVCSCATSGQAVWTDVTGMCLDRSLQCTAELMACRSLAFPTACMLFVFPAACRASLQSLARSLLRNTCLF